jgi:AcrR family transcriptional regulator
MSPRSQAANQAIRAESRALILEHALELFATHGYDRTTIRGIAESAGISQGLIYNYFRSKDELLRAIFEQSMADVRQSFATAERAAPGGRTAALIRSAFELLERNRRFWRISYGVRMQPGVLAELGEGLHRWTQEIDQKLQGYLREDGFEEPALEGAILFALIDGVSQHYVLDPGRYPLDAVVQRLVARYQPTRAGTGKPRG